MEIPLKKRVDYFFNMRDLLKELGFSVGDSDVSIYCPFHDDKGGGHKSARYYVEDNNLYCWSCVRAYGPYDALVQLGFNDKNIIDVLYKEGMMDKVIPVRKKQIKSLFGENKGSMLYLKSKFMRGVVSVDDYFKTLYMFLEKRNG